MIAATIIFGSSLLLVPYIGGEFMPHLDEARVVRATAAYTIRRGGVKVAPQNSQYSDVLSAK